VALALCIAAPAHAANWRVSGTLAGTYDNSTTWTQCNASGATGTASEHVDLDVRLRPAGTADFARGNPQFGAVFRVVVGGRWSLNGSYAPRSRDARGEDVCGAPIPIACGGNVINPRGSNDAEARLLFARKGRTYVGQFASFAGMQEDATGQPNVCNNDSGGDDTLAALPLLGFTTASAQADLIEGIYRVPVARLNGRHAFSVSPTPATGMTGECSYLYVACSQTNRLAMKLTFKPAH
jgi:hypothetical protein